MERNGPTGGFTGKAAPFFRLALVSTGGAPGKSQRAAPTTKSCSFAVFLIIWPFFLGVVVLFCFPMFSPVQAVDQILKCSPGGV